MTKQYNSVCDEFCVVQKKAFDENHSFTEYRGFRQLGASLNKGHVLVLSLWDGHDVNMLWRNSVDATNSNKEGSDPGPWESSSGAPIYPRNNGKRSAIDLCGFLHVRIGPSVSGMWPHPGGVR
jgi:hypothetical protein